MADISVAPNHAVAKWSDGDVLVLMRAATSIEFHTRRFSDAFVRWHRAMTRGRRQGAARADLRGAAITVARRAARAANRRGAQIAREHGVA